MNNTQTVQEIYTAFGQGDTPRILSKLSDSAEWDYSGNSAELPWLRNRRGKQEISGFFTSLNELEFEKFEPKEFLENGKTVVVLLSIGFKVKATGEKVREEDAIHVWRFDDEGKVERFRHGVDTYRHYQAYKQ